MARAGFEFEIKGRPIADWLTNGHPALKSKVSTSSNTLAMEFAACERFGIDPLVAMQRPRDERIAITAYHAGKSAMDTIYAHETKPKTKPGKPNKHP